MGGRLQVASPAGLQAEIPTMVRRKHPTALTRTWPTNVCPDVHSDETPESHVRGYHHLVSGTLRGLTKTIMVSPENSMEDMEYILQSERNPVCFATYLADFLTQLHTFKEARSRLMTFAWHCVVSEIHVDLLRQHAAGDNFTIAWSAAMRVLIKHGADPHEARTCDGLISTGYATWILGLHHPFDADEAIVAWLDALKAAGVEMEPYVQRETRGIASWPGWSEASLRKRLVFIIYDDLLVPSWRWKRTGVEVVDEFAHLGYGDDEMGWKIGCRVSLMDAHDFQAWLAPLDEATHKRTFPFRLHTLDLFTPAHHDMYTKPYCRETYRLACLMREKRLSRRHARKTRRGRRGLESGMLGQKMPGSWVD